MPSVIILAGGVGERFWPVSRNLLPKQFLKLCGEKTLLEETFNRAKKITSTDRIFIVTTENFVENVKNLLDIPPENIITEPVGRNTAPCLGYSVSLLNKRFGDDVIAVLPSDHLISDEDGFIREMFNAFDFLTKNDGIVTFGIKPTRPETNYGYILREDCILNEASYKVFKAKKFVEKPSLDKAQDYVKSGIYFWNSGMFIFKASFFLDKFKVCLPKIHEGITNVLLTSSNKEEFDRTYKSFPSISVDYGIMENIKEIYVLSVNIGWDDLGNWISFENISNMDRDNNIVIKGNFINLNTKDSIIYSEEGLIAAIGVENLIIAKSKDAVLVCNKNNVSEIKSLVSKLEKEGFGKYK
jgi:mannose-1-phosphate guanylyltransferase